MGKSYQKAPAHFKTMLGEVMSTVHSRLLEYKTKIDMLSVFAPTDADGFPSGPALTHNGVPCLAKISIVKLKDRTLGRGDAEILIDGDSSKKWSEARLRAVLDHELTHLELTGNVDDLGRPKFKMRQHDVDFGWFDEVARRHPEASVEVKQATSLFGVAAWRQLYLPGVEFDPSVDADTVKPSITRHRAAKELCAHFKSVLAPGALQYVSVPHEHEGERRIVEAWVDQQDRAVIFYAGELLDVTGELRLSARWSTGAGDKS